MQSTMDFYDMSREELMERSMKILNHIVKSPELVKLHQAKALHTIFVDYMQGQVSESLSLIFLLVPLWDQSLHVFDDYLKPWH